MCSPFCNFAAREKGDFDRNDYYTVYSESFVHNFADKSSLWNIFMVILY